jgi:hypothetical protein
VLGSINTVRIESVDAPHRQGVAVMPGTPAVEPKGTGFHAEAPEKSESTIHGHAVLGRKDRPGGVPS